MAKHHHDIQKMLIGEDCCMGTSYYGNLSGIGYFNFTGDMEYICQSTWTSPGGSGYKSHWCDTGYQNLAAAAKDTGVGWVYDYGVMETADTHSFTLLSFMAAASWSANQSWVIVSYVDDNGMLQEKSSKDFKATFSKAETIKLGNGFHNIAAIAFELLSYGSPGNTCTYGTPEYGLQLAFDKIRFYESKKADLKHDNGHLPTPYMLKHPYHVAAHVAAVQHLSDGSGTAVAAAQPHHGDHVAGLAYHSQLLSLGHDAGLTGQFELPHAS